MIEAIEVPEDKQKRAQELAKKIDELIKEASKEFKVMICETDDGDAVSVPEKVEYDSSDNKIYIHGKYE